MTISPVNEMVARDYPAERAVLMTATARIDPARPALLLVTLRRYDLDRDSPPTATAEVASADDAIEVLSQWLHSISP